MIVFKFYSEKFVKSGVKMVSGFLNVEILRFSIRTLILMALAPLSASGQSVGWGTHLSAHPLTFDSRGVANQNVLTWELGWFSDGFTPTSANFVQWSAHWHNVDTSVYQNSGSLWGVSGYIEDVGTAAAGKLMYMFAHNGMDKIGTTAGEVLLLRQNDLRFPAVFGFVGAFDIDDATGDSSDDAFTVIWGRVDRKIHAVGGVLAGAGAIPKLMPDNTSGDVGTFEVQSASWALALYYAQWRTDPSYFSAAEQNNDAISGMWADPDQDGVANAMEYLSGGNPREMSVNPLTITRDAGVLRVACKVDASTLSACTWKLRHSVDLAAWTDALTQPQLDATGRFLILPVTPSQAKEFWRMEVSSVMPVP